MEFKIDENLPIEVAQPLIASGHGAKTVHEQHLVGHPDPNVADIREGRETVSKDYSDPARFFDRTYMTESLLKLCSQGLRLGEETAGTTKSCSSLMATGRWPFSPSAVAIVTTGCHVVSFSPY